MPSAGAPSRASVADRLRRRSATPWIIAGAILAALALTGAGVWLWIAATPQVALGIEIEEFAEAPEIGTWSLPLPGTPLDADDLCEAGQNAALVITRDAVGYPDAIALLNTKTGELAWTTQLPAGMVDAGCVAASVDRAAAVISTIDAERRSGLLSIDLEEGAVTRPPGHLELLIVPDALDGDVIASTGTAIGRFDLVGLVPVWTLRSTGASVAAGSTVLIVDAQVISLATGTPLPWTAGTGAYGSVEGALLRVDRDGAQSTVIAIDEATGRDRWTRELRTAAAVPVVGSGFLLVIDGADSTITAIRVSDGGEQWSIEEGLDPEPGAITGSGAAGVVILPITADAATVSVVDLARGDERFLLELGDPANPSSVVAITASTITMAEPGAGALVAIDAMTGEERWRAVPAAPDGTFLQVGGQFVQLSRNALIGVGQAVSETERDG